MTSAEALTKAISIVGSQVALASRCGTRQSMISYWVKQGYVPRWWAEKVSRATKFEVPAGDLIKRNGK